MPEPIAGDVSLPALLKVGDDLSTDEISPAGGRALPFRSSIPKISAFAFDVVDESYAGRAEEVRERGGHAVVGGDNYGQGSSREHAALAPCHLGLRPGRPELRQDPLAEPRELWDPAAHLR